MEILIEIIFEIIFDGALELTTKKKVPMFFRVLAAVILLAFYIGLGGILIYVGIINKSGIVVAIAVLLLLVVAYVTVKKYKEIKRK